MSKQNHSSPSGHWSRRLKLLASVLLLLHMMAVLAAPWSSPPPASFLSQQVAAIFRPYLEAAYLYHGYRFFAPNPGPSHLVRYEVTRSDGSTVEGRFPDRREHWPRLLYHRHFMLSETLFNRTQPFLEAASEEMTDEQRGLYETSRQEVDALVRSVANHLMHQHHGIHIKLFLVQHDIPGPIQIQETIPIDDPRFFRERPLGEFPEDEL